MTLLTKRDVCKRWQVSPRTVDRLRAVGKLAWINVAGDRNSRPAVRFDLSDVEKFEQAMKHGAADNG